MNRLAVFPLPIYLLPGGVTRLRIFEPRYIRMVKDAAQGKGFALSLNNDSLPFETSHWAAHVHIVDFDSLNDGLLSITIKADALVSLVEFEVEEDKLLTANATPINHWPQQDMDPQVIQLANELENTFDQNAILDELYQLTDFKNPNWVVARWLELMPLSFNCKKTLTAADSFEQAKEYLGTVILGDNKFEN